MSKDQSRFNSDQEFRNEYDDLAAEVLALRNAIRNMVFTAPGLVIGSSAATKVKIANTVNYTVDGLLYTKATAEIALTATTHDLADDTEAYYYLTINSSGTVTITKGTVAAIGEAVLDFDEAGAGTLLGYVLISNETGALFDATTTELGAEGLTVTYVDNAFAQVAAPTTFA